MQLDEPMTLATDYLLAAVSVALAVGLERAARRHGQLAPRLWALAFGLSALAALIGGSLHGLRSRLPSTAYISGWQVTLHAVALAGFLLLAGTCSARLVPRWRRPALVAAGLKFLLVVLLLQTRGDFRLVVADYSLSMLGVLLLELAWLGRDAAAGWIVGGLLLSFVAAGLQVAGVGLGPGFNHNDLYHVVQIPALVLLARGGARLVDQGAPAAQ